MVEIVPVIDEGLGNSAYVVDLGDGGALVVDPQRDPRPYLDVLRRRGLRPRFVAETHLHADFVSGGRELAALGARLLASADSDLAFPHTPVRDGDEVDLGGLTLRALATPGHTPEHLSYLLSERGTPVTVFSGGTLIAGGVARTDLLSPEQTVPLARAAYRSITQKLLTLPDDLVVRPTHGGGSFCSATPGGERVTTIGHERASNPLLTGDANEDQFVGRMLALLGSYPPYFLELREENRRGLPVLGETPATLAPLSPDAVERAVADGAVVVDARDVRAFAAGHVPGAICIPWRAQFATWLGWLVPRDRRVMLVGDEHTPWPDLIWAARTIGFERLEGALAGGVDAWRAAGHDVARTTLVDRPSTDGRAVVDVRQRTEYASGHAPGALHVELGDLASRAADLPPGPLLVHCGHGERAMSAASLLERAGREDVAVLAGGPDAFGAPVRDDAA